jgi:hypothetical protein
MISIKRSRLGLALGTSTRLTTVRLINLCESKAVAKMEKYRGPGQATNLTRGLTHTD